MSVIRPRRPRRGATMLLVIATLMTGTVIATAFLASRDNSSMLGTNICDAASARSLAASGLELGVAVLQTESDWRTAHAAGRLVSGHALGAGTIDIDLVDMETGLPPTVATTDVSITCTATVNDAMQAVVADASLPSAAGSPGGAIPLDLQEFAVYTRDAVTIRNNGTISRWTGAPLDGSGRRVPLGTGATAASAFRLMDAAAAIDATLYHGPGVSTSLISNATGPEIQTVQLPTAVHAPRAADPPAAPPDRTVFPDLDPTTAVFIDEDARYALIQPRSGLGSITVQGVVTLVAENDLVMESNTGLLIDGDVTLVVFGDITMAADSYIELLPGANLSVYADGHVIVTDAYIGDWRADRSVRDHSGSAAYMDPERIRMFTSAVFMEWNLEGNSVLKGSLYIPDSSMFVENDSALYGRVACYRLVVSGGGGVFYDHALDSGRGYTDANCELFEADGTLPSDLLALDKFSTAALESLATATGRAYRVGGKTFGAADDAGDADDADPVAHSYAGPTPRPVPVEYTIRTYASDVTAWENR